MTTNSFVHSSIGTTTDEANDFITVDDSDLALVTNIWSCTSIGRVCLMLVDFIRALSKHTKRRSSRIHDEAFEKARMNDRLQ